MSDLAIAISIFQEYFEKNPNQTDPLWEFIISDMDKDLIHEVIQEYGFYEAILASTDYNDINGTFEDGDFDLIKEHLVFAIMKNKADVVMVRVCDCCKKNSKNLN